jgi:hypothetical protein
VGELEGEGSGKLVSRRRDNIEARLSSRLEKGVRDDEGKLKKVRTWGEGVANHRP